MPHHFISYSSADARDFAARLADDLRIGARSFNTWLDVYDIPSGEEWDEQIAEGIRTCESLIFVMTEDSVKANSVCKNEWTWALKYKKPITPLRLHAAAELPFRLASRDYIDFSSDFATGLAELRKRLHWLSTPAGQLQALKHRLLDAERDLPRAHDPNDRKRIDDEIVLLRQQIASQEYAFANPQETEQALQMRIDTGLERERKPQQLVASEARARFINPPPVSAPNYFQDRHVETRLLVEQLKNRNKRLLTVVGRGGVGKTAMVCRLLEGVEVGQLPDELGKDLGELPVDGLIYLCQSGTRQISAANLFADLCKLLPEEVALHMNSLYCDSQLTTDGKIKSLLAHFADKHVVVLLDNLEDLIDPVSRQLNNQELDGTLQALLRAPVHGVVVICTTRIAPQKLALVQPQLQSQLSLDEGLESPFAENILRAMDSDGKLGLRDASSNLLTTARVRTRGYPRALEALVAILASDRSTTLSELLEDKQAILPEYVVETLVGEAYSRLDRAAQMVMQALAIYARPVTASAVDYLLQPYLPVIDGVVILNRLVNMHFVRKESDRYYLHPVDRSYALEQVPEGIPGDDSEAQIKKNDATTSFYTRYSLWHRAANYFAQARLPRSKWTQMSDLSAQLAEFELRCAAQEYSTAADVLEGIDFDCLLLWGHAKLLVELRERLLHKLSDLKRKRINLGNLGLAQWSLGKVEQAIEYQKEALDISRELHDRQSEGAHLGNLGNCYADLGEVKLSIGYYIQALAIASECGDRRNEGAWLGNLGKRYIELGDIALAITFQQQAIGIVREIGDRRGEGNILGNLGVAYAALGQTLSAIEHYEQALVIAIEIRDRRGEGTYLGNLGLAYAALGQTKRAIGYYEQALAIAQEIGDRRSEGIHLGNLGLSYATLGQVSLAIQRYTEAIAIQQEIGDRLNESKNLSSLALAYANLGQPSQVIEYYEQALVIARKLGDRRNEGLWLGNLGNFYNLLGQEQKSIKLSQQALDIAKENDDKLTEAAMLGNIGNAYFSLEELEKSIEYYKQALAIQKELGDRLGEGIRLSNLGNAYFAIGKVEEALECHQKSLAIAREIDNRSGEGTQLGNLGTFFSAQGNAKEAIEHYQQALLIFREIGDRRGEGITLGHLGLTYNTLGAVKEARGYCQQALDIAIEVGDRRNEKKWRNLLEH